MPPYRRVVDASAWVKASKSVVDVDLGDADAGVGDGRPGAGCRRRRAAAAVARMKTSPASVNFTAFEPRLVSTWASRVGSPASTSGTSGWQETISSRPLARAASAEHARDLVEDRPHLEVEPLELELAGLDLREVEDVVDDAEQGAAGDLDARRRAAAGRRRARLRSSRSLRPITPLSGVRISWLIVARNSDFCRDASIARVAGVGELALGPLALGDPAELDGDLLDHRLDHVEAVERRRGGDRRRPPAPRRRTSTGKAIVSRESSHTDAPVAEGAVGERELHRRLVRASTSSVARSSSVT